MSYCCCAMFADSRCVRTYSYSNMNVYQVSTRAQRCRCSLSYGTHFTIMQVTILYLVDFLGRGVASCTASDASRVLLLVYPLSRLISRQMILRVIHMYQVPACLHTHLVPTDGTFLYELTSGIRVYIIAMLMLAVGKYPHYS